MLVAGLLFAAAAVFVKLGAPDFTAAELGFYRSVITAVVAYPVLAMGGKGIGSPHMRTHLVRSAMGAGSVIGYFYGITQLPLATAVALNYTSPLFLALTTTVILRERFSPWLVVAIVLGFAGVAMLLQPNFEEGKSIPALIGLSSGAMAAWAYLAIRSLGRDGEPEWRVVFWFAAVTTVLCGGWQLAAEGRFNPVRASNWWILVGLGLSGLGAQLAMTRAYSKGNALVAGALSYSTIVFSTLATLAIWADRLSWLEWAGMAVIVASGLMAMRAGRKPKIEEITHDR